MVLPAAYSVSGYIVHSIYLCQSPMLGLSRSRDTGARLKVSLYRVVSYFACIHVSAPPQSQNADESEAEKDGSNADESREEEEDDDFQDDGLRGQLRVYVLSVFRSIFC